MPAVLRRIFPIGFAAAAAGWICARNTALGDYPGDAGPAIEALAAGRLDEGLAMQPLMGPLSIFLRAPLAALGGSDLAAYNWGSFVCVLAVGLLGIHLSRLAARRGAGRLFRGCIIVACIFNPVTFEAVQMGHPEELLGGALLVASAASAVTGAPLRAALLLGLAMATKQWAVIGFLPILMALPARRVRAGIIAIGVALALVAPTVVADPEGFIDSQMEASTTHRVVTPWNVWYPVSTDNEVRVDTGEEMTLTTRRQTSEFVGRLTHPLIVGLGLLLPLAIAFWRGRLRLTGPELMAILALLFLLRCAIDPYNNLYYHAPLLLALACGDALLGRTTLPVGLLSGTAVLAGLEAYGSGRIGSFEFSLVYSVIALVAAAALCARLHQARGTQSSRPSHLAPTPAPEAQALTS